MVALSERKGEALWQVTQSTPALSLHFASSPVITQNKAIVGSASGKLMALHLKTGLVAWERTVSTPRGRSEIKRMVDISADPIVTEDAVYAITYQGKLAALDLEDGNLMWERDISAYQNMAVDAKQIYITDNQYHLWAIDRQSGAIVWKQEGLASRYITGPCVYQGVITVGDKAGYIHMVAADTGHLHDRFKWQGKIYQTPTSTGKGVLVSNHQGKLAAIGVAASHQAG